MASSFVTNLAFQCRTTETLDSSTFGSASGRTILHDQFDVSKTLNATSTAPVSVASHPKITSGTSGTIDLTALTAVGGTIDATGKKLQVLRINNKGTGVFSIVEGASNGYALGAASAKISVSPGGTAMLYFPDTLADVAAGDKTLDWTNTIAGEVELTLLLG